MKVLITCGPTWVPIDQVRVISNTSTGLMGHEIADSFIKAGAKVTLLEGPVLHPWENKKATIVKYAFFNELEKNLRKILTKRFDVIVHAAAVSDFNVENPAAQKLDSSKALTITLKPTKKLIELIRHLAPKAVLVGFKLESSLTKAISDGRKFLSKNSCDLLIANSSGKNYKACLLDKHGRGMVESASKKEIAQYLVGAIMNHIRLSGK